MNKELDAMIEKVEDLEGYSVILGAVDDMAMESASNKVEAALEAATEGFWAKLKEGLKAFWERVKEVIRQILEKIGLFINKLRVFAQGKDKTLNVSEAAFKTYGEYTDKQASLTKISAEGLISAAAGKESFDSEYDKVKGDLSEIKTFIKEKRDAFHKGLKGRKEGFTVSANNTKFIGAAKETKAALDKSRKTFEANYKALISVERVVTSNQEKNEARSDKFKRINQAAGLLREVVWTMVSYGGTQISMAYSLIANKVKDAKAAPAPAGTSVDTSTVEKPSKPPYQNLNAAVTGASGGGSAKKPKKDAYGNIIKESFLFDFDDDDDNE